MSLIRPSAERPGGVLSPGRLRALGEALLRCRDSTTARGEAASYLLTARAAELFVVADLMDADPSEWPSFVSWLVAESSRSVLDRPADGEA